MQSRLPYPESIFYDISALIHHQNSFSLTEWQAQMFHLLQKTLKHNKRLLQNLLHKVHKT